MLKRSHIAALLVAVALTLAMGGLAFAHEVPDLEQTGAVEVTMKLGEEPVGGGAMALYRVGDIHEDDGNYSFVLTDAFADSGVALDDIQSADVARTLADYAASHNVPSQVKRIGASGTVSFNDLPLGLYLLVQTRAATGYSPTNPFLAAVPTYIEGSYYYTVDASPKVELEKEPNSPSNNPNQPSKVPQTADNTVSTGMMVTIGSSLLMMGALISGFLAYRYRKGDC